MASAYNEFWWDRGVHAARINGRTRTSLIVNPPDGRIPALTPDGQRRAAARAEARRAGCTRPTVPRIARSVNSAVVQHRAADAVGPYNNTCRSCPPITS